MENNNNNNNNNVNNDNDAFVTPIKNNNDSLPPMPNAPKKTQHTSLRSNLFSSTIDAEVDRLIEKGRHLFD